MKNLMMVLSILLASCSGMVESGAIDGYRSTLANGQYEQAIKALDLVEKSSKRYPEAQKIKENLQIGLQIFSTAQGSWRYQDGDGFYSMELRPNSATWATKIEGNTIYTRPWKCNNDSAFSGCAWSPRVRFIDYEGNGRLRVRRYGADPSQHEEHVIFL